MEKPAKLAVKLKEAAALLSISVSTLRRKVVTGEIKACRATRHLTFAVEELARFQERNTLKP